MTTDTPNLEIGIKVDTSGAIASLASFFNELKKMQDKANASAQKTSKSAEDMANNISTSTKKVNLTKVSDGFKQTELSAGKMMATLSPAGASFGAIAQGAQIAYGAIVGLIGGFQDLMKEYIRFEKAMDDVSAVLTPTGDEFTALTDKARQLGRDTMFTAQESAVAMKELATLGFNAKQILASVTAVTELTSASSLNMGQSALLVGATLRQFSMDASRAGEVVDLIAHASNKTALNATIFGEAMKYAGTSAKSTGSSIEDATAMIGALANMGLRGGNAGRNLSSAFDSFANSSSKANKLLKKYGIEGDTVIEKIEGMQKAHVTYSEIIEAFGKQGGRAVNMLVRYAGTMKKTKDATEVTVNPLRELVNEMHNADGAGERMSKTMMDNIWGAIKITESAFESLKITLGGVFAGTFRSAVEGVGKLFNAFERTIISLAPELGSLSEMFGRVGKEIYQILISASDSTGWKVLIGNLLVVADTLRGVLWVAKKIYQVVEIIGEGFVLLANIVMTSFATAVRFAFELIQDSAYDFVMTLVKIDDAMAQIGIDTPLNKLADTLESLTDKANVFTSSLLESSAESGGKSLEAFAVKAKRLVGIYEEIPPKADDASGKVGQLTDDLNDNANAMDEASKKANDFLKAFAQIREELLGTTFEGQRTLLGEKMKELIDLGGGDLSKLTKEQQDIIGKYTKWKESEIARSEKELAQTMEDNQRKVALTYISFGDSMLENARSVNGRMQAIYETSPKKKKMLFEQEVEYNYQAEDTRFDAETRAFQDSKREQQRFLESAEAQKYYTKEEIALLLAELDKKYKEMEIDAEKAHQEQKSLIELEAEKKRRDERIKSAKEMLSLADNVSSQMFEIGSMLSKNEEARQKKKLTEYEEHERAVIDSATMSADEKERLNKELSAKVSEMEKEQAKDSQRIAVGELWVSTALGIGNIWADSLGKYGLPMGPIFATGLSGLLLAKAGVQQSAIESQSFWSGGDVKNTKGSFTGDREVIYANPGEKILTEGNQSTLNSVLNGGGYGFGRGVSFTQNITFSGAPDTRAIRQLEQANRKHLRDVEESLMKLQAHGRLRVSR